ncbi:MAG: GreA/GreB family elongation factor [Bacteroidales bacterium]|nr:GreA/GreB family elongation factor [Bacteroidales bacterium]
MSRAFTKEGDQEEIPRVPLRAYLPEGVPNYVTKEGLAALNEELKKLEAEHAKAGDNYIMSNFIEAKMKLLISRINSAVEVDLSKANKETVSFGAWVRYNGRVVRIVGVDEADISKGLLSFVSPLAKAMTGKKAGDVIELKGAERIIVEVVSYEPMELTQMAVDRPLSSSLRGRNDRSDPHSSIMDFPPLTEEPSGCEHNDEIVLSSHVEETHQFEPEVNPMQFLPIVNERGNIVGRALYMELHGGNKMLHPVAHLHVVNGKGEITKRYWWHVAFGDTPEKTLKRKMSKVLGLSEVKPKLKRQYIREAKNERELVYVFTVVSEEDLLETPEGKDYTEVFEKD